HNGVLAKRNLCCDEATATGPFLTSLHRSQRPNMRLKLTGDDRFKGTGVLCPWRGTDCRPLLLRRRASRPQLKRDPLGRSEPQLRILQNHYVLAVHNVRESAKFYTEKLGFELTADH